MFHCTFTSFLASQTISQSFTMITTGGRLQAEKHCSALPETRIVHNDLYNCFHANQFLFWKRSSPESYTQSHASSTGARALETAAVIYVSLTGSTIPATAVTMA